MPRWSFYKIKMSDDALASANRTTNASDVGLIVQGTLILLSALVAVGGYFIQGRLRKKERRVESEEKHKDYLRKAELDLLREKLKTFVGPATGLVMSVWNTMWRNCFSEAMLKGMGAHERHGAGVPRQNLNSLAGGDRISRHWNGPVEEGHMGFTFFPGMMKGTFNGVTSLVGKEVEAEIRADPSSELSRHYFRVCRRMVERYAVPLRALIAAHSQTLDMRLSAAEFKEQFPVLAGAGWLRNLLYLDFIEWTTSFEEILAAWDGNDYTLLWPPEGDFPLQLTRSLTDQLTEIREKETALGTATHKVLAENHEEDRIKTMAKNTSATNNKSNKQGGTSGQTGGKVEGESSGSVAADQGKPSTKKKKYVVAAVMSAAGSAVAAAATTAVAGQ